MGRNNPYLLKSAHYLFERILDLNYSAMHMSAHYPSATHQVLRLCHIRYQLRIFSSLQRLHLIQYSILRMCSNPYVCLSGLISSSPKERIFTNESYQPVSYMQIIIDRYIWE